MTAVALTSAGSGTLPKSTPGSESTVTVSDTTITTTCSIVLTRTDNVEDGEGPFKPYVYSQTNGSGFVVRSDRGQLPLALTFDYVSIEPAS